MGHESGGFALMAQDDRLGMRGDEHEVRAPNVGGETHAPCLMPHAASIRRQRAAHSLGTRHSALGPRPSALIQRPSPCVDSRMKRLWLVLLLAFPLHGQIRWQAWSDDVFARAKREHRFVLLDLEAVWC